MAIPIRLRVDAQSPIPIRWQLSEQLKNVIVCSSSTGKQVKRLVDPSVPVIIDDRALNQRAIQMLGAVLAQHDGDRRAATASLARQRPRPRSIRTR